MQLVSSIYSLYPGPHYRWRHDLLYVGLAGEMRTVSVTLGLAHTVLKECAEYLRLHLAPVLGRGVGQQLNLIRVEFDRLNLPEDTPVEVGHRLETSAACGPRITHLAKEGTDQVVRAGPVTALLHKLREYPTWQ